MLITDTTTTMAAMASHCMVWSIAAVDPDGSLILSVCLLAINTSSNQSPRRVPEASASSGHTIPGAHSLVTVMSKKSSHQVSPLSGVVPAVSLNKGRYRMTNKASSSEKEA